MQRIVSVGALVLGLCSGCGDAADPSASGTLPNFPGVAGSNGAAGTAGQAANPNGNGSPPGSSGNGNADPTGETNPGLPLGTRGPGTTGGSTPISSPLPRSTPETEGVSSAGLLALVTALDQQIDEVHSVMLVRHGKVVLEGFWAPYAPGDIHVTYSVSKSFNATAVGLAIEEGLLNLDDPILSHFADIAPAAPSANMQAMQVRHLLMMATGHTTDTMDTLRARADGQWTRAFLETTVPNAPGTNFLYNSGAAYVLASLVQRTTGVPTEEYLASRLFEPLGIDNPLWGKSPEGVNMGDGGLSVRTEDLAKLGQLYLQGGLWNGARVLPAEWVLGATSSQISTGNRDSNWGYGYGFQFWQNLAGGYRADGSLGQFSIVLPEHDLVLAITSGTQNTDGVMNVVWQNLIPALSTAGLPEDTGSLSALSEALDALSVPSPVGAATSPQSASVSGRRYAMNQNAQGVTGVTFDFAGATPALTIEDANGAHVIPIGVGNWLRGRTGYRRRINELFDTPEQGIAASGAWATDDTFEARLVFNETPYTMISRFRFAGEQVFVDSSYNVRWGNTTEPQIVGTR